MNYVFYDIGVTTNHDDDWNHPIDLTRTRDFDKTVINYTAPPSRRYAEFTPRYSDKYIDLPFAFEFDLISIDNYCLLQITGMDSTQKLKYMGQILGGIGHYKIVINSTNVSFSRNNNVFYTTSSQGSVKGYVNLVFDNTKGDSSIAYRNFIICNL